MAYLKTSTKDIAMYTDVYMFIWELDQTYGGFDLGELSKTFIAIHQNYSN